MANVIIDNDYTYVKNPTVQIEKALREHLTYEDKSIKYQLQRMSRNAFSRSSAYYKKLQGEVSGCLIRSASEDEIVIPSGFASFVTNAVSDIEDRRHDTGVKLALPWMNKPFDPRDYQEETLQLMLSNYRGLINLATGLGKTLIAVHAVQRFKKKTLIVCPTESIAKQFHDELVSAFGQSKIGFFGGGKKKINDITVGIAASVYKGIDAFVNIDLGLVIFDEVHHIAANTFYDIADKLAHVGRIFGLTATDYRSDGKDVMITAGCGEVLVKKDIVWGVASGWLAQPYFIVREVDTSKRPQYKHDKIKNYKSHILNCPEMKSQIQADIKKFIDAGKVVLCLVDEVAHGQELATQLGIPFATGKDKQSQEYVDQLNSGKITGLIGTDGKISEGTNMQNIDVLVLASFVASKGPLIQSIGRGLRKTATKTACVILDYIPTGSDMLARHAYSRIKIYRSITDKVKII